MDVGDPARVLTSKGTAAVLRVLVGAGDTPLTMRAIARLAGVSPPVARDVLLRLTAHGLVLTASAGSAIMCRYNSAHLAADAVRQLVGLRAALIDLLRSTIASWPIQPLHASLFGSAARGDGGVGADLDVLVVRPDALDEDEWEGQLYDARMLIQRRVGNPVAWFEVSLGEASSMAAAGESVVGGWRTDGITLAGQDVTAVLAAASSTR